MIKKAKRKMISFSVDQEVYERLHQYAFEQHQSMSAVLTGWIMNAKVRNDISWRQQQLFSSEND